MVNHGLSTGALFLLVGMLYDRRHTKKFAEFGGLAKVIPVFSFFLVFSSLASVGLPALNGFAGEFLILAGSFQTLRLPTMLATFGVVLAAIYLLKMLQLTIFGPLTKDENRGLSDLKWREIAALVPLCVFMLWIGLRRVLLSRAGRRWRRRLRPTRRAPRRRRPTSRRCASRCRRCRRPRGDGAAWSRLSRN